jgi:hypothetical protein
LTNKAMILSPELIIDYARTTFIYLTRSIYISDSWPHSLVFYTKFII